MADFDNNYIFISYCHNDTVFHSTMLAYFDKYRFNVVDDSEIDYGDQWDLTVRKFINSPLCKGVVCLLSESSLKSKNVLKEIDFANAFGKKILGVVINDDPLCDMVDSFTNTIDAEVAKEIQSSLGKETLYISKNKLVEEYPRIERTFSKWGITPYEDNLNEQVVINQYSTDIDGEKERLEIQQKSYTDIDTKELDSLMDGFDDGIVVVDLGCSTGIQTFNRFDKYTKIKTIIGVDYNEKDIDEAISKGYGDRYHFFVINLDEDDVSERIHEALRECGAEKADLMFCAMTLHHLKYPEKLLSNLYDLFSPGGKIYIRAPDDGGKCCYPDSELLEELLKRTEKLVSSASDRYFARKVYSMLFNTGYRNIRMKYSVYDTCERSRSDKEFIFRVAFDFRLNRLNQLEKLNKDNPKIMEEIKWQKDAIAKIGKMFMRRDFWFQSITYVAIAEV